MAEEHAFPNEEYSWEDNEKKIEKYPGMELRDYFAAKALNGMLANSSAGYNANPVWCYSPKDYAEKAYELADAMMKRRES